MKKFEKYSANPENPNWEKIIKRETLLYSRNNDIRNDFERDYTRIIHSNAYRRLKHKYSFHQKMTIYAQELNT